MLTLQPINIVEPFNHQRKGHANEYKVSSYPNRALLTAAIWSHNDIVIYQALIIITLLIMQVSMPANNIYSLWAILNQKS